MRPAYVCVKMGGNYDDIYTNCLDQPISVKFDQAVYHCFVQSSVEFTVYGVYRA